MLATQKSRRRDRVGWFLLDNFGRLSPALRDRNQFVGAARALADARHKIGARTSIVVAGQLRYGAAKFDFDAPTADQLTVASRGVKNDQLFWLELFFAVIAVDTFGHTVFARGRMAEFSR
jgi:hypothetical protein